MLRRASLPLDAVAGAQTKAPSLLLIGCGAAAEFIYAPLLQEMESAGSVKVTALFDPLQIRMDALGKSFPQAHKFSQLDHCWQAGQIDLAIVCSPPRWHAEQTLTALNAGVSVLCEKPMSTSAWQGAKMVDCARTSGCKLAIGQMRRFFPATRLIYELIATGALGRPISFSITEGHRFSWPAMTSSFFDKQQSGGGVLLDIGAHVLDLICWWFGPPSQIEYEDDAMGGVEANCCVTLLHVSEAGSLTGCLRLSRDHYFQNHYSILFENGSIVWEPDSLDRVKLTFRGVPTEVSGQAMAARPSLHGGGDKSERAAATTIGDCFRAQLNNFIAAAGGRGELLVPAEEVLKSIQLIEDCYAKRRFMPLEWLNQTEMTAAKRLQRSV